MRPETRAYLKAHRGPQFVSRDPDGNGITVKPTPFAGVSVTVDDHPEGAVRFLTDEEAARLRDWLTTHLDNHPAPAGPPTPPGTTVELTEDRDWMWGCDHRDCSTELEPGRWFGTATGGFTSELSARQGLAAHLAEAHPTQTAGWPDPDEEPDAGTA